jgi:hypothetical protein
MLSEIKEAIEQISNNVLLTMQSKIPPYLHLPDSHESHPFAVIDLEFQRQTEEQHQLISSMCPVFDNGPERQSFRVKSSMLGEPVVFGTTTSWPNRSYPYGVEATYEFMFRGLTEDQLTWLTGFESADALNDACEDFDENGDLQSRFERLFVIVESNVGQVEGAIEISEASKYYYVASPFLVNTIADLHVSIESIHAQNDIAAGVVNLQGQVKVFCDELFGPMESGLDDGFKSESEELCDKMMEDWFAVESSPELASWLSRDELPERLVEEVSSNFALDIREKLKMFVSGAISATPYPGDENKRVTLESRGIKLFHWGDDPRDQDG